MKNLPIIPLLCALLLTSGLLPAQTTETKAVCRDTSVQLDNSGQVIMRPKDICVRVPGDPTIEYLGLNKTSFTCIDLGPNPVILTVFNTSGAQSSCTAVVTVMDNSTAPCTAVRWYVQAQSGDDNNDGRSWATAFADLQQAIDSAGAGDHIWVAAGTYRPSAYPRDATTADGSVLPDNNRYFTFHLPDGVQIYGGFAGTENYRSERRMGQHPTVLDGNLGTSQVYHVVTSVDTGPKAGLDGFVITGGRAAYLGNSILVGGVPVSNANGGGIYFSQSRAFVRNVAVVNNYARADGGGIAVLNASPWLTNIVLAGNSSDRQGGGLYATASAVVMMTNATVSNNTAKSGGSGLYGYNESSVLLLSNTVCYNNVSGQDILTESGATLNGEAIFTEQSPAAYGSPDGCSQLTQDPFTNSADPDGPDNCYGTTDDGLQLAADSPLLDAGRTRVNGESIDLLGNSRLSGVSTDVGAYEQ